MPDNSGQQGTDTIATDEVATLNGAASSGVKVQRVKVGYGDDGEHRDASNAYPFPVELAALYPAAVTVPTAVGSTTLVASNLADFNHTLVRVGTTTTGTFRFEVTADGTNWRTARAMYVNAETWAGDPLTPTAGDVYRVLTYSYRALRVTVVTALGAAVTVAFNQVGSPVMTSSINIGPAPHAIGHAQAYVRATGTATAANTTVLVAAPAAGMHLYVTDVQVANSGAALTVVSLHPGATTAVLDFPVAATGGGASAALTSPWRLPAATSLNYSVSAATTSWFLTVGYYVGPAS